MSRTGRGGDGDKRTWKSSGEGKSRCRDLHGLSFRTQHRDTQRGLFVESFPAGVRSLPRIGAAEYKIQFAERPSENVFRKLPRACWTIWFDARCELCEL